MSVKVSDKEMVALHVFLEITWNSADQEERCC